MASLRYAPEFRVTIDDRPVPAALRASISAVSHQTGLEGADRVELTLVNEGLRWLDHRLLALDNRLTLALGYAPDPLEQMFVGEIVGQVASFPSGGTPALTLVAQDRRQRLQSGSKARWFAVPTPIGPFPLPDLAVAGLVSLEHGLIPIVDPVGATLALVLGGIDVVAALGDPIAMQKVIRKQDGESDFEFLGRIARENGWEMLIDHAGSQGGFKLRFFSPLDAMDPVVTLRYGRSLVEFTPRVSTVGQIAAVTARVWRPEIKLELTVTVSWDWDRQALSISVSPGGGLPGLVDTTPQALEASMRESGATEDEIAEARGELDERLDQPATAAGVTLVDEPVTLASAARLIVSRLVPTLNGRLTGSGSAVGDPRIRAGAVLRLEGVGERFGGLYRVTSATHTIDSGGYRTGFEVRKEIWFGSIPLPAQGAVPVRLQGRGIA